jgi:hypothetical protein
VVSGHGDGYAVTLGSIVSDDSWDEMSARNGKALHRESSQAPEALKQVIERHQHSPGYLAKFLPCTFQRNHPPSLPAPESEDFPRLPIRLFAYHYELLSIIVFHDEPFHLHATSSPFPASLVSGPIVMAKETNSFRLQCPASTPYDKTQFILFPPCVSLTTYQTIPGGDTVRSPPDSPAQAGTAQGDRLLDRANPV